MLGEENWVFYGRHASSPKPIKACYEMTNSPSQMGFSCRRPAGDQLSDRTHRAALRQSSRRFFPRNLCKARQDISASRGDSKKPLYFLVHASNAQRGCGTILFVCESFECSVCRLEAYTQF